MNKQSQPAQEPQVVDLGDAKALTMGYPDTAYAEEDQTIQGRMEP